MSYKVELSKRALKQLYGLERKTQLLVAAAISEIESVDNPTMLPNAKKLQGVDNGWRWRAGSYRIIGTVDGKRIVVEVFRVGHRRDVHQNM